MHVSSIARSASSAIGWRLGAAQLQLDQPLDRLAAQSIEQRNGRKWSPVQVELDLGQLDRRVAQAAQLLAQIFSVIACFCAGLSGASERTVTRISGWLGQHPFQLPAARPRGR